MPDLCGKGKTWNLLITGKPGSGKGTQASLLIQNLNIKHISTGEIFRREMQSDSELGRQVKTLVQKGELVPDPLTNAIVKKALQAKDYPHGFLLDGYPRTKDQAVMLDEMLQELKLKLDGVIQIRASDQTLLSRLAGRRVCTNCQETYHIVSHPPQVEGICDKCQHPLIQRPDDQEAAIKIRLDVYNEKTRPLLEYYQNQGLLWEINGEQDPESVYQEIIKKTGKRLIMITIKSEREILLMRQAGLIVYKAHQAVLPWIKPGVSTHELDDIIESAIRKMSATPSFKNYNGFPAASCISINEEVIHGIPSKKKILKEGDLVSIDIGANYKGYHGDSAWSYGCGKVSEETRRLLEGTKASLFEGLKQAKAGNRLSDISHAIQMYAEGLGFSVVREFVGHGIGKNLHEDPAIPNYGLPGRGVILRPGMTIAIEPMINFGRKEVRVLADGWTTITADGSLSAHFEHTVLITETGCDIFTTQGKEE